jgi:emp24/gp25L/p24 family/GOLD
VTLLRHFVENSLFFERVKRLTSIAIFSCVIVSCDFCSERATMSVFILAGPELKATITFDGPLPDGEEPIRSGTTLQNAIRKWDGGVRDHSTRVEVSEVVDFEHLNIGDEDEGESGEEENEEYNEEETMEQRRDRRARQRKKALEARQRRDQRKMKQRQKVRQEGEPFQKTVQVPAKGWYRFCVRGSWYQVTAEMDLRKESEMGGLDENGHVWTVRRKAMEEEEKFMEEDTAESEGITDEDFQSTREKLKTLRRLLADIQSKQSQERHRLIVHAATNEHSHSRMVLSSLMETILFMAVTGFQVYTIRKWFRGAPVLGR